MHTDVLLRHCYLLSLRVRFINLTKSVLAPLTRYILSWRLLTRRIIIHQNKQGMIKILTVLFDLFISSYFKQMFSKSHLDVCALTIE